jgi:hypothetical protein
MTAHAVTGNLKCSVDTSISEDALERVPLDHQRMSAGRADDDNVGIVARRIVD